MSFAAQFLFQLVDGAFEDRQAPGPIEFFIGTGLNTERLNHRLALFINFIDGLMGQASSADGSLPFGHLVTRIILQTYPDERAEFALLRSNRLENLLGQ